MGGNKRQRLARRRFSEGTGEGVSKQEVEEAKNLVASAPENGSKQGQKKKQIGSKKRKAAEINEVIALSIITLVQFVIVQQCKCTPIEYYQ